AVAPATSPDSMFWNVLVVLFFVPADVAVTLRLMVHWVDATSVPPERLMEPEPATAVTVPPQTLLRLFGVATANPAGRLSVKAIPVRVMVGSLLVMVNVRDVDPPKVMLGAPKALLNVGAA